MSSFDNNFKPQDDFYHHVNNNWLKDNPIPDDKVRWCNFIILYEKNKELLKDIILNDKENPNLLYTQGINDTVLDTYKPLNVIDQYIQAINNMYNSYDIINVLTLLLMNGFSTPLNIGVEPDLINSNKNIIYLDSGGIGLPDRDYYFLPDKENIRDEYKKHLQKVSDFTNIEFDATNVYNFEQKLAKETYDNVTRRNPHKLYNMYTFDKIKQDFEYLHINQIIKSLNLQSDKDICITTPTYYTNLCELIKHESLTTWKSYLTWKVLQSSLSYLSKEARELHFDFYGKILSGQKSIEESQKRVTQIVDNNLGEPLSKLYVDKYFSEKHKDYMLKLTTEIKLELRKRLTQLDWMTNETKTKAISKIDKMGLKIGYPDEWKDYSTLKLYKNDNYFNNILRCRKWENEHELNKLNKPVNKKEWHMNAHDVNAYYSPSFNEIVFPAGILKPPFFSSEQSAGENFGGIGVVIGHEMTHGFDDQGRKFDADGNMNDWWTETDAEQYVKKTNLLRDQFNEYTIEEQKVNGELTLGENIADLGGLEISFSALDTYLTKYHSDMTADEIKQEHKKFFITYARVWRANIRPEESLKRLVTDPHSPNILRVNGILKNMNEFYKIFNVTKDDKLYIDENKRAQIW
jgi:putative endopeptidase